MCGTDYVFGLFLSVLSDLLLFLLRSFCEDCSFNCPSRCLTRQGCHSWENPSNTRVQIYCTSKIITSATRTHTHTSKPVSHYPWKKISGSSALFLVIFHSRIRGCLTLSVSLSHRVYMIVMDENIYIYIYAPASLISSMAMILHSAGNISHLVIM